MAVISGLYFLKAQVGVTFQHKLGLVLTNDAVGFYKGSHCKAHLDVIYGCACFQEIALQDIIIHSRLVHDVCGSEELLACAFSTGCNPPDLLTVFDCCLSPVVLDPSDVCFFDMARLML